MGGIITAATPTGKSVSVSFRVRVVRACEAAWARKGHASSTLEARIVRFPPPPPPPVVDFPAAYLMLYTRVLRKIFHLNAIHKGFNYVLRILCYTQGL